MAEDVPQPDGLGFDSDLAAVGGTTSSSSARRPSSVSPITSTGFRRCGRCRLSRSPPSASRSSIPSAALPTMRADPNVGGHTGSARRDRAVGCSSRAEGSVKDFRSDTKVQYLWACITPSGRIGPTCARCRLLAHSLFVAPVSAAWKVREGIVQITAVPTANFIGLRPPSRQSSGGSDRSKSVTGRLRLTSGSALVRRLRGIWPAARINCRHRHALPARTGVGVFSSRDMLQPAPRRPRTLVGCATDRGSAAS